MTKLRQKFAHAALIAIISIISIIAFIGVSVAQTMIEEDPIKNPEPEFTVFYDVINSDTNFDILEEEEENIVNQNSVIEENINETTTQVIEETSAKEEVKEVPQPIYYITSLERDLLASIIYLEGNGESYECQKAICSVVINRWQNGYWGNTIEDVLFAPGQFTPAQHLYSIEPTELQYQVVDDVIYNGINIPYYVMYFRANYYFSWAIPYTYMDNTYFSYQKKDIKY